MCNEISNVDTAEVLNSGLHWTEAANCSKYGWSTEPRLDSPSYSNFHVMPNQIHEISCLSGSYSLLLKGLLLKNQKISLSLSHSIHIHRHTNILRQAGFTV